MTKEEKIAAIYAEIANKELTLGCKLQTELWRTVSIVEETTDELWYIVVSPESLYGDNDVGAFYCWIRVRWLEAIEPIDIAEIIWHPVMIGDVLDWVTERWLRVDYNSIVVNDNWSKKRLPIEDQSDECIDYVYSLTQKD